MNEKILFQKKKKDAKEEVMEQRIKYCLTDKTELKDCKKRHTNLSMAWIDYRNHMTLFHVAG